MNEYIRMQSQQLNILAGETGKKGDESIKCSTGEVLRGKHGGGGRHESQG